MMPKTTSDSALIAKRGRLEMTKAFNLLPRRLRAVLPAVVAVCWAGVVGVQPAAAELQLTDFNASVTDADGRPVTQAGAHPFAFTTHFAIATQSSAQGPIPAESMKDVDVELPPGMMGDPSATPQCAAADFSNPLTFLSQCPVSTQIGTATVDISGAQYTFPVFNLVPPEGVPAQFGFVALFAPVYITPAVRTGGDYGLTATIRNVSQALPVNGTSLTLWGVPADPAHDPYRGSCLAMDGSSLGSCPSGIAVRPFLTLPTSCSTELSFTIRARSWNDPSHWVTRTATNPDGANAPAPVEGCEKLPFNPSIALSTDTSAPRSPAGYTVELRVPQTENPVGLSTAHVKRVQVAMPPGTAVSPSGADGLQACSLEQVGLSDPGPALCPDASKIGTVSIDTPVLSQPLEGSVYLAQQNANPFNSLLALYLVADGEGVRVKLAGKVTADPSTGDLTATFDDTPQLPFSRMQLIFQGGSRAPLMTPSACGPATATASMASWGGRTASSHSTIEIAGCRPDRFSPSLRAGVAQPVAGTSSPFAFQLTRPDGDRDVSTIRATLPRGLLASVRDVPLCPLPQAAAGTCGSASLVGHVTVGAGPGATPFYLDGGRAYLTEGSGDAPYGLSLVVPAIAGPLDLGTVVVRADVRVDQRTAQISVDTQALPTMLDGIPLELRDIRLTMDRPGFMVNPTNCSEQQVTATVVPTSGPPADLASRFQVGNCAALSFAPQLAMSLTSVHETRAGGHPGVTAILTQRSGEANLRQVRVSLPKGIGIDLKNASGACKAADAAKGACPDAAIVGRARAITRVLPHALVGPVYLVEGQKTDPGTGRTMASLPQLWVPLRGDVALDLWADTAIEGGQIVTTFADIPDAPIAEFQLAIDGGPRGLLMTGKDLCGVTNTAKHEIDGQNGKRSDGTALVTTPCTMKLLRKRATATELLLRVGGVGAGRLTISGDGIRRETHEIARAQVVTLHATLTAGGRRVVAHGHALRPTVSFTPATGGKAVKISTRVSCPACGRARHG